jgi:hypothetical protein
MADAAARSLQYEYKAVSFYNVINSLITLLFTNLDSHSLFVVMASIFLHCYIVVTFYDASGIDRVYFFFRIQI